ncbi:transglutaminase family protein [Paenibacillus arenilitoris]|uniref:Transglutaminase family protein n=1 Tax=Paenibacillus arenilitoris TaxID=2772299 RepID=A0A927CR72_9BACL|nr:transglutaminase family protein [Paenibacillus arenilitoris]MBD2872097.1 transglutaminase family protein [Paenibacillus arenilitoris]
MKLSISHVTQYDYAEAVSDSVNEIRLTPSTNERQSCYQQSIAIEPNASLFAYEDYFGNRVHAFSVNAPHRRLTIRTSMTVVTKRAPSAEERALYLSNRPPETAWRWLQSEEAADRFAELLLPTEYTAVTDEVEDYAGALAPGAADGGAIGVLDWLTALSGRIRSEFVYDPEATDVKTKTAEMFVKKRGVCQDFAHLMIACSRSYGIPARYVSGYHFVGDLQGGSADFEQASHAWVEAFVPGLGWCSFDPTNADPVGERYVKLGHGRDYKDIVPVKGVYRGTGDQELRVTVDVRNIED